MDFQTAGFPTPTPSTPAPVLTKPCANSTFSVLASAAAALRRLSVLNLSFLTGDGNSRAVSRGPGTAVPNLTDDHVVECQQLPILRNGNRGHGKLLATVSRRSAQPHIWGGVVHSAGALPGPSGACSDGGLR